MRPSARQRAFGRESMVVRQVAGVRGWQFQPYHIDDKERHVGAGFDRGTAIGRRISANNRHGIATSASWNVTYRPCRATLAPILTRLAKRRQQCLH
jgi:hypothetical protein